MSIPVILSFSKEYNIDKDILEKFWRFAKKQYGEDYKTIVGTVKRMAKNYKKFKLENNKEELTMNNIDLAILALEDCGCGGKCKKKTCKCKKKKKGAPLTGDELKNLESYSDMIEGRSKRDLEAKVEKVCTCDGGISLDHTDHEKNCPANDLLDGIF